MVSKKIYEFTRGEINPNETPETITFGYEHPVWKDVLTSYNGDPVTYDAMGNITSLGDYSYTWTGGRQLKSVTNDEQHFEYFYNADGKLEKYDMYDVVTSQPINGESTETIRYSGTVYYFWNEDSLVSMCLEENGQLLYNIRIIYDADGEAMGICLNDSGTFLYQKDLQGDIVALITPDGQIVLEYIYDSYGNFSINTPDNSVGSAILAMFMLALNPLSYRGYMYAPGIGVSYYLGSRFYSPEICRFMNADVYVDTLTGAVSTNMFAYCNNSPVNLSDPTGTNAITSSPTYEEAPSHNVFSFVATVFRLLKAIITLGSLEAVVAGGFAALIAPTSTSVVETTYPITLSDVKAKVPNGNRYRLAYVYNGNLKKIGRKFTFVEAIEKLGFTGATNSLSQRFTYNSKSKSIAYQTIEQEQKNVAAWGIFADNQKYAKALAVVFNSTKPPEVNGEGEYGHYHDNKHHFHIWFGKKYYS